MGPSVANINPTTNPNKAKMVTRRAVVTPTAAQ